MTTTRKKYDADFKSSAVQLVLKGRTISEVAMNLGITTGMLSRWRQQYLEKKGSSHMDTQNAIKIYVEPGQKMELPESTQLSKFSKKIKLETIELTNDIISNLSVSIGELCNGIYIGAKGKLIKNPPQKFLIEFGLQITGKTSIKIIEASADAQIKVTAEWDLTESLNKETK